MELRGERGDRLKAILEGKQGYFENVDELDTVKKLGFVVDHDINELNVVKEIFRLGRQDSSVNVGITIIPTLACNFKCSYCYEKHAKTPMSKEIQNALVEFVRILLSPGSAGLTIGWFGGEPLLELPIIESLSLKLKEVCRSAGINPPVAEIITNGYLLTPETVTLLMRLGVRSAQVTFDGPPDIHDSRRPLTSGLGSFQTILDNLKSIPDSFKVNIRINIDSRNKDSAFDLLKLLVDEKVVPKATPYVSQVESFSQNCLLDDANLLKPEEFNQFRNELLARCHEEEVPWISQDSPRLVASGFCIVDQAKGFLVEPDGTVLKCWAEVANETAKPIAHLSKRESWDNLPYKTFQNRNPFDDEECCDCKILPICLGGCPHIKESLRLKQIKRCPTLRYSLAEDIRTLCLNQLRRCKPDRFLSFRKTSA